VGSTAKFGSTPVSFQQYHYPRPFLGCWWGIQQQNPCLHSQQNQHPVGIINILAMLAGESQNERFTLTKKIDIIND
jgi:hypothetical protein